MNESQSTTIELPERYRGATPGPWKTAAAIVYAAGPDVGSEKSGTICACGDIRKSKYVEYVPLDIGAPCFEESCANARLIADAPKLAARVAELEEFVKKAKSVFESIYLDAEETHSPLEHTVSTRFISECRAGMVTAEALMEVQAAVNLATKGGGA